MEDKLKLINVLCPVCKEFILIPLAKVLFADSVACGTCSSHFSPDENSAQELWKQVQQSNFAF